MQQYLDDSEEEREQILNQQKEIEEAVARLKASGEPAEVVDRPGVLVEKYMNKKGEYEAVLNAINIFRDEVNEFARQLEQHYGIKVPYLAGGDTITTTNVDPSLPPYTYLSPQISVDEIRSTAAMPPSADPTDFAGNIARSLSAITGALKS